VAGPTKSPAAERRAEAATNASFRAICGKETLSLQLKPLLPRRRPRL